ncbi:MlaC/ttg2D family ABC transporter substrate-binding protein [Thalassococcus lentus]|uniref:ABC transporter substrate-binding protein n=1 Tax=Thalassococcus lentus TaxID=1210524 RepID=A0ABT4XT09_9RHOB|nr:ABC transporter substrate-binding protein [Thalassococcus lentus]MDA7425085.1 ABC transporter substrate-binding protein [Thalassococcus lentus]
MPQRFVNTRRGFTLGGLAMFVGGFAFAPQAADAASAAQAEKLVDNLVADINRVIASGKSESAIIREFEGIFKRYADLRTIAATAMGVDGRRASSSQKKAFTAAFSGYISRKYGRRFREFIGGEITVNDTKLVKNAFQVSTTMKLRGEAPFEVVFFVGQKSGKFFNMHMEGINMLLTERTEVGAMLDKRRGDIDAMIADLKRAG